MSKISYIADNIDDDIFNNNHTFSPTSFISLRRFPPSAVALEYFKIKCIFMIFLLDKFHAFYILKLFF